MGAPRRVGCQVLGEHPGYVVGHGDALGVSTIREFASLDDGQASRNEVTLAF